MAPLILAGLSLLPKIPEMWGAVAGLFGKEVPTGVEAAGKLAGEILGGIEKGTVTIQDQIQLKTIMYAHEEKIIELRLKEKQLDYEHQDRQSQAYVSLEAQDAASSNQIRAETRPKILRDLFKVTAAYTLIAPLAVLACMGMAPSLLVPFMDMLKWIGGWLFGTFSAAYLGYTTVRSVWDKKGEARPDNAIMNALSKVI